MHRHHALLIALALGAMTIAAHADEIPDCPPPPGAVKMAIPAGLPPGLRVALGDVALPGEKFDATDVRVTGHNRRYIFVWTIGPHWIVAIERGGIGYSDLISAYDVVGDGKFATRIGDRVAFPPTLCTAAAKFAAQWLPDRP